MSYRSGYHRGQDEGGSSSTSIKVDSSSVGKIIGRGGRKISELEQTCRARIKISREADEDGMTRVKICGSDSEIEKARWMNEECLAGDYSGGGGGGGNSSRGRSGGLGGSRGRSGGGFGRRYDGDNWGHRDRENGDSYQRRDDYDRGSRNGGGGGRGGGGGGFGSSGGDCETIFVESSEVGRIIGGGCCRIRDMEADSRCMIKMFRDGDSRGCSSVELLGSKSAISEAKRLIQEAGVEIVNGDDRSRVW